MDDDSEQWIRLIDATWVADELKLKMSVDLRDDRPAALWDVTCSSVVEQSLCCTGAGGLAILADSPLLKPFLEPNVPIMFSENTMAPETLLGIVCSCCTEVMGRSGGITSFMNGATTSGICSSAYGLLGPFPELVARHILHSSKDKPIKPYVLEGHRPKRWNGFQQVDYETLAALEFGRSYVIAERFSASRAQVP